MAAHLTDKQKKKIVADYLECESYNATAKKNGVCGQTVRRVVEESQGFAENLRQKKEENTADILAYMESKRNEVCELINVGLEVLPEKIKNARSASEVTTALGTIIDKWAMINNSPAGAEKEDDLSRSLKELGKELESDE